MKAARPKAERVAPAQPALAASALLAPFPQAGPTDETITLYATDNAGNCTATPKTSFEFGDKVCAKVDGGPGLGIIPRSLVWSSPDGVVLRTTELTEAGRSDVFTVPARDANDFRAQWRVTSVSQSYAPWSAAAFNVSDPAARVADLVVYDNIYFDTVTLTGNEQIEYTLWVVNRGPDAAANVSVTSVGTNSTFFSAAQTTMDPSPAFDCTTTPGTCTLASMPAGTKAAIRMTYTAAGSPGQTITNTATITSDTAEARPGDNTSSNSALINTPTSEPTCSLHCPADITVPATTTQGMQRGAIVKFDVESGGDCGLVTSMPASGAFFPVGTTNVVVSATGDSCSFVVTVTDDPPPTISCPAGVSKAAGGDCSASFTLEEIGEPTTGGGTGDLTVAGARSDGAPLVAPYPLGNTTIVWTVTDEANRSTSCNQLVTVTGTDTTPPTIVAPPNITDNTGTAGAACGRIIGETQLGTPETDDNCAGAVTIIRTGVPAGNFFPVGTTTITYKAKDKAGNESAPVTQTVTITENTPPIIKAPADATYVCASEVPAASPSQATRGDVFDENGNLLPPAPPSDNCGVPVVTVTETSSGAGSAASPRVILRTFTATDASGNSASDTQTITVIDPTPPTIVTPANITVYLPLNSTATSMAVSYSTTGSDNCAPPTITFSPASGSVFPVGTTTVTATATDGAGNTASTTFTVTVLYNFTGFFQPVDNLPTLNVVNAGRAIPVKFSLSGNKGLNIFAANSPYTVSLDCGSGAEVDVEETLTAGSSSLSYSSSSDQYNYVWKTESSWAGTCRQLVVKLNDGSEWRANFKFR